MPLDVRWRRRGSMRHHEPSTVAPPPTRAIQFWGRARMNVRTGLMVTGALAAVCTLAAPMTADAQPPPQAPGTPLEPYTPAADARDLKSVLFNWTRNMGMLKGTDEREMVATLEYKGTGTVQVDGAPCDRTSYRASTNYQTFSQRIQYTCTRANGQSYSNIEVVSGLYAWDEDKRGAEL